MSNKKALPISEWPDEGVVWQVDARTRTADAALDELPCADECATSEARQGWLQFYREHVQPCIRRAFEVQGEDEVRRMVRAADGAVFDDPNIGPIMVNVDNPERYADWLRSQMHLDGGLDWSRKWAWLQKNQWGQR